MLKTLLAPRHAAVQVGVSPSRLIQLELQGELEAIRDSAGRRFYDPDVIEELIQRREAQRRAREQRREPQPSPAA